MYIFQFNEVIVCEIKIYCETSNISHILVGNQIVDHSDVVEQRRCSNYIFILNLTPSMDFQWIGRQLQDETRVFGYSVYYTRDLTVVAHQHKKRPRARPSMSLDLGPISLTNFIKI